MSCRERSYKRTVATCEQQINYHKERRISLVSNKPRIPKISVVMSAYNAQEYLDEAIISILDQSFRDFEFIIIDDGSTDRTNEIIRHY
ncbi:glycosyltransferase family 2 protein, partial [Candidatus Saccharibacteria bacterium]